MRSCQNSGKILRKNDKLYALVWGINKNVEINLRKLIIMWKDSKGRNIQAHTMSNRWLNNIRKKYREKTPNQIIYEIKRRKNKNSKS